MRSRKERIEDLGKEIKNIRLTVAKSFLGEDFEFKNN